MQPSTSERALILAPHGRDGRLAAAILIEGGIAAYCCDDLAGLAHKIGEGVGFVVIAAEALAGADLQPLTAGLDAQEPWSDIPFILLTQRGGGLERNPQAQRDLTNLRNVTFLERPFHPTSLLSLATAALRARRRQYEARSRIAEISERELALRESERQFRTLADTMPALCYIADAAGALYWFNQRWYEFTGTCPEDMVGNGWQAVHDPALLPGVMARWTHCIATGEPFEMVFPLRSATGEFRPHLARCVPMRADDAGASGGRITGWFGTNTDITDQQAAELALRNLADELELRVEERTRLHGEAVAQLHEAQKIETLGQLTGGVAHDFNNLLTPIVGALDLLGRLHQDARSQRLIRGAQEASERSRTLISRLLAFARRQVLAATAVDVSKLVEGMADLIKRSLGPQIAMSLDLDRTTPPAWIDANQLELALLNLAVNARDAMPEGGELTISVKLDPGQTPDDACVTLVVADTGLGMDARTLARAIEPFFSTKSVGKGTGLGLSMVHGLAAQSGGKLILASEPGQGTSATLTLPVAAAVGPGVADASVAADETMRPMQVLLVDDHELARDTTAAMLAEMGHAVTQCGSAEEALAVIDEAQVEFVVSDYLMTGMNGSQLMQKVHERTPHLPFALISGFAHGEDGDCAVKLLAKPFTRAELARAMLDGMRACATG